MNAAESCLLVDERTMDRRAPASLTDEHYSIYDDVVVRPRLRWYRDVKTAVDFVVALIMLVLLTPVIAVFATLVKLTSAGPAFYTQKRLGLNNRVFTMIKLRTMVQGAESGTGAVWAQKSDPRITRLGAFMRCCQIDEFPQLINVLFGDMSLIGPRPERPEIADRLEMKIPYYRQRLAVKPGITGLAQLRLPADTDLDSVRLKLIPDMFYVRNVSPWLDARIFFFTGTYFVSSLAKCVWAKIALPTVAGAEEKLIAEIRRQEEEINVPNVGEVALPLEG